MDASPNSPPSGDAPSESSSLTDRLAAVICAPSEVFEEIRNTPVRASNWLVPLILACIATAIYISIAFSQPAILRDLQVQREHAVQKKVAAGKITQAQADQAAAMTEQFLTPTVMKAFGVGGAVLACVAGLFLMGVAIWLSLKYCAGARLNYMKVIEICGLALLIDVPQKIIRSGLVLWKANFLATLSPTLFLAHPNATNKVHLFLSMFDIVDFWWLAVLSLGVSKVASMRYRPAAFITFGVWYGFRIVAALLTPTQS
ncbi:MAG TPA: YIP1 family protein [Candidatus Cybelea sp.]|nr:YIP1 family protein [Candidatus Cybelea sp.]